MASILQEGGKLRLEIRMGASQVIVSAAVLDKAQETTWVMTDRIFSDPMSALVHLAVLLDPPREEVMGLRHREPTHVCNACGATITYGAHAKGCPGCTCGMPVGVLHAPGCPALDRTNRGREQ